MRTTMGARLAALVLLAYLISPALGAAKLQVVVTSSSGQSVYINQGRSAGVVKGQRVRFHIPGRASIEGVVVAVTKNSARVDLPPDVSIPTAGTPGEIELADAAPPQQPAAVVTPTTQPALPITAEPTTTQSETTQPETQPATTQPTTQPATTQPAIIGPRKVPDHPAWRRYEPVAEEDEPLLSPALIRKPQDRPTEVSGRVFTDMSYGQDPSTSKHGSAFANIHGGLSLQVTNPIGEGGRFQFEALAQDQYQDTGSGSTNRFDAAPQLLSYAQGGEDYQPYRFEIGRFYSYYLPELGLIDGVEGALRLENGFSFGAGVGMFPHLLTNHSETYDYGCYVFGLYESKEPGDLAATLGYVKSWHNNSETTDEIIGRVNAHPIDPLWLFGSFRLDINTSNNNGQGSGVDLAQAWGQARYDVTEKFGVGASFSHYIWTQIQKDELDSLSKVMIADGRVDRGEFFAWYDITKTLRLGGNVNYWVDKDNSGTGGEMNADWNPDWAGPSFHLALYETDGASATGRGARLEARKTWGRMDGFFGYEIFDYSQNNGGSSSNQIRHAVRGGLNWRWNAWYYGVTGHYYFGDGQEVVTLGLHMEYRF